MPHSIYVSLMVSVVGKAVQLNIIFLSSTFKNKRLLDYFSVWIINRLRLRNLFDSKSKRCEKKMKAKSIPWWCKYAYFSLRLFSFVTSEAKLRASRFEGQSLLPPSSVCPKNKYLTFIQKLCANRAWCSPPANVYRTCSHVHVMVTALLSRQSRWAVFTLLSRGTPSTWKRTAIKGTVTLLIIDFPYFQIIFPSATKYTNKLDKRFYTATLGRNTGLQGWKWIIGSYLV